MTARFTVGTTLVYPHHGAVTITALTTRTVKGVPTEYMTLRVHGSELVIQAAIDKADYLGIREITDPAGVDKVFAVLRQEMTEEATNWSRRFKDNQAKVATGDVYKIAEVVRDVWRREQDKGISAGERGMLSRARQILTSELALALAVPDEEAAAVLERVLTEQPD